MALFDRTYNLVVGEAGQLGLKISDNLHIEFSIKKSDKPKEKNKATFTIFNLSDEGIAKITSDQKVLFQAGYLQDEIKTLFLGQVEAVSSKREGATVKTTIKCKDGYVPVREGYTGTTFKGGATVGQVISDIVTKDMKLPKPHLNNGALGPSKGVNKRFQHAVTKAGNSADILTKLCNENFLTWVIKEGTVSVYPVDGSTNIVVPRLSSTSGMIGSPQRVFSNTNKTKLSKDLKTGFKVKSLLNGAFNIGDLVQVDSEFTTGLYRISKVEHKGSFRGTDWFSNLMLLEGLKK